MCDIEDFFGEVFDTLLEGEGMAMKYDDIFHAVDGRGEFMCSFLVQDQNVFSTYPYVEEGHEWPIRVEGVHLGPSPLEAQITGTCHGARVGLFDTLYFRNKSLYDEQPTLGFMVTALAYELSASASDAPSGISQGGGREVDDLIVTGEIVDAHEFQFWDIPLTVYTVSIPAPDGETLMLNMYTPLTAQVRPFEIGETVRGEVWLFGQVPIEEDEAAEQPSDEKGD